MLISLNCYAQMKEICECGFSGSIAIGTSLPLNSSIKEKYEPSYNIDFSLGYILGTRMMIRGNYQYIRFENKADTSVLINEFREIGKMTSHVYKADLLYGNFDAQMRFQWYLIGGLGLYTTYVDTKINENHVSDHSLNLGVETGIGFSFRVYKTNRIFMEGKFDWIFTNKGAFKTYFPLRIGYNFNFIDFD